MPFNRSTRGPMSSFKLQYYFNLLSHLPSFKYIYDQKKRSPVRGVRRFMSHLKTPLLLAQHNYLRQISLCWPAGKISLALVRQNIPFFKCLGNNLAATPLTIL